MLITEKVQNALNEDDTVFHYTKMKTGFEKILAESKIILSPFNLTNDPLEYNKKFIGYTNTFEDPDKEKSDQTTKKEVLEKKLLYGSLFISTCMNKIKSKDMGYFKLRMWSQYGEDHNGLCFALSKSKIKQELKRRYNTLCLIYSRKIEYNHKFDDVYRNSIMKGFPEKGLSPNDFAIDYIKKENSSLFFKKYKDYRDENEYRFVVVNKSEKMEEIYIDLKEAVKAVILGEKQNPNYIEAYTRYKNKYKIPFIKAKWYGGRIELHEI